MKKSCMFSALLLMLLPIALVVWWFGSWGEVEAISPAPLSYRQLSEAAQDDVPPFAENIYLADYAHWQVGEWARRFDIPPGSESALREWVNTKGGQAVDVAQYCLLSEMTAPDWWSKPEDARLVSNRRLKHRLMSMWFSPSQHRVWILYKQ